MDSQMLCYCGSQRFYKDCCEPYIMGTKQAPSPESLMRSRFSAYAVSAYQYILDTYANKPKASLSLQELADSDTATQWKRLEVLKAQANEVEFKALYTVNGLYYCLHERSRFVKEDDAWRYLDGEILGSHAKLDIGRNSPCPCNSGKKFKRCCG